MKLPKKLNINIFAICVFLASLLYFLLFSRKEYYQFNTIGRGHSFINLIAQIFIHNYSLFLADILSFIFGRWLILVSLTINMIQLGWILGTSKSIFTTFFMLLPHGIFEITAIILMANLCWKGVEWAIHNKRTFIMMFSISNFLLLIAAIIESTYLIIVS